MTGDASRAYKEARSLSVAVKVCSRAKLWNRFVTLRANLRGMVPEPFLTIPLKNGETPQSDSPLGAVEELRIVAGDLGAEFIAMCIETKLSGVAYRVPKLRGDKPVWVPAKDWSNARVIWKDRKEAEVQFKDTQYQDVRFVASDAFIQELRRHASIASVAATKRAQGRPSRESQVNEALKALDAEGRIPKEATRHLLFPRIRGKVHELYPNEKPDNEGLGDKALYKFLKPWWKARRKAD